MHDPLCTCSVSALARLLGVRSHQYYNFISHLKRGRLPSKMSGGEPLEVARRLHALRYWALQHAIVDVVALEEALAYHQGNEAGGIGARNGLCVPRGSREGSGRAVELLTMAPTLLPWRGEEDELKRTIMVSALPLCCYHNCHRCRGCCLLALLLLHLPQLPPPLLRLKLLHPLLPPSPLLMAS